jgi:hypothetical protein
MMRLLRPPPHRHLSAIVFVTWSPLCSSNDRRNLLDVRRPRDGDHWSDTLLGRKLAHPHGSIRLISTAVCTADHKSECGG